MKYKRSLFSNSIFSIILPVTIILFLMSGLVLNIVSKEFGVSVRADLLVIFGIELSLIISVILLNVRRTSKKISLIAETVSLLTEGDFEVVLKQENFNGNDQLKEISIELNKVVENLKTQTTAVKKMAHGDFSVEIKQLSEKDELGKNLKAVRDSIKQISEEVERNMGIVEYGCFNSINVPDGFTGEYKKISKNIQKTINKVIDQIDFYASILDAIPSSFFVTDHNMKFKYMNKVYEDYLIEFGFINNRESAYQTVDCSVSGADMCGTENCARRLLSEKGIAETFFEVYGLHYKQDMVYLKDRNGDKTTDVLEMSTDMTAVMSVNAYTREEIIRLEKNLNQLVNGQLDFDINVQEANEYTVEVSDQFNAIGRNLEKVKQAIGNLISNATDLATAAVEGNLHVRVDETKFNGSWKELIIGMNDILMEISKPIDEVSEVMNEIFNGNLNTTVNGTYRGSFEELKQSVNNMGMRLNVVITEIASVTREIGNRNVNINDINSFNGDFDIIGSSLNSIILTLNDFLRGVSNVADQVAVGSTQVALGSQTLAQGTIEQASVVQELTDSITEIAEKTIKNAEDANKASILTTNVMENAEKGNVRMTEMQKSMDEINQASGNISKIIKAIDDIAFQTNILALNAAVEAARAGQHGRGFAVVAEEVRNLAVRSAEAVKETTGLIEGSIRKVKEGMGIANETAEALEDIVNGIEKTTSLIKKIAISSNEQATEISQINRGVVQVDQVVQQNSATAEESAAASEELSSQAEMFQKMIKEFQLRGY